MSAPVGEGVVHLAGTVEGPAGRSLLEVAVRQERRRSGFGGRRVQPVHAQMARERRHVHLAVGHRRRRVLREVAEVVALAELIAVPELMAEVVGVVRTQDSRYDALVRVVVGRRRRPHDAVGGRIGRDRQHPARHAVMQLPRRQLAPDGPGQRCRARRATRPGKPAGGRVEGKRAQHVVLGPHVDRRAATVASPVHRRAVNVVADELIDQRRTLPGRRLALVHRPGARGHRRDRRLVAVDVTAGLEFLDHVGIRAAEDSRVAARRRAARGWRRRERAEVIRVQDEDAPELASQQDQVRAGHVEQSRGAQVAIGRVEALLIAGRERIGRGEAAVQRQLHHAVAELRGRRIELSIARHEVHVAGGISGQPHPGLPDSRAVDLRDSSARHARPGPRRRGEILRVVREDPPLIWNLVGVPAEPEDDPSLHEEQPGPLQVLHRIEGQPRGALMTAGMRRQQRHAALDAHGRPGALQVGAEIHRVQVVVHDRRLGVVLPDAGAPRFDLLRRLPRRRREIDGHRLAIDDRRADDPQFRREVQVDAPRGVPEAVGRRDGGTVVLVPHRRARVGVERIEAVVRRGDEDEVMSSPVDLDSRDHEWLRVDQAVHFEIKELAECAARHGGRRQHRLVRVPAGAVGVVVLGDDIHAGNGRCRTGRAVR